MFEAEFTHEGDKCTFEVLLDRAALKEPALRAIAEIIHDIDLKDDKFGRTEVAGIRTLIEGIAVAAKDDSDRARHRSVQQSLRIFQEETLLTGCSQRNAGRHSSAQWCRRNNGVMIMQQAPPSISPADLYARLGTAAAPNVVDVRRPADFAKSGELIVSAFHRDPDEAEQWGKD